MSDENERSVASAGSQPVSGGPITLRLSNEERQEVLSRLSGRQSGTLLPLDLPKPTLTGKEREAMDPVDFGGLTDKEREAIEKAIGRELDAEWYGGKEPDRVVALRGLLERTK
jgi:hypothetical protein